MKVLKIIGISLLVIVVVILLAGLIMPKEVTTERTVKIKAPPEVIYANISNLKMFNEWSPWHEMEPGMKVTFEGEGGQAGQKMSWVGEKMGTGSMQLTSVTASDVENQIHFMKPFESQAVVHWIMSPADSGNMEVKWTFNNHMGMPMNVFGAMMGMKKMLNSQFDRGLELLKQKSEAEAMKKTAEAPGYTIVEAEMPEMTYMGIRQQVKISEVDNFFKTNLPMIAATVQQQKMEMAGPPVGLYYDWDMQKNITDMAAAVPVKNAKNDAGKIKKISVPAGNWLTVDYHGAYDNVTGVYTALDKYVTDKGYGKPVVTIEQYITDPAMEKDTSKWLTKISYVIKK